MESNLDEPISQLMQVLNPNNISELYQRANIKKQGCVKSQAYMRIISTDRLNIHGKINYRKIENILLIPPNVLKPSRTFCVNIGMMG